MDHPLPWLRYVDASNVQVADLEFDGLKVRNDAFEKLGDVEGLIIDRDSLRPYYVVVDSGGWFKSKDFLVPIGHLRLDEDRDALVVDIPKERIDRFPGFDRDSFERLTPDDIRRMNDEICVAASETPVTYASSDPLSAAWSRPDYQQPDWWNAAAVRPDRMGDRAYGNAVAYPPTEHAIGTPERDRELVTARESEPSPHHDGRAQPGDVLGPETGGERTYIGDTSEDENKRRLQAEKDWRDRKGD